MGNNEDGKSSKFVKPSSPAPLDQSNIHVYPDWAAMQAYYGPRVAIPPYYSSPVASGHAPHPFIWGPPQPMMPPYGAPYAAIYPPGGVYAHPTVPMAVTPPNAEVYNKSSGNTGQGLAKKIKGLDGLAMSGGNSNAESAEGGAEQRSSRSEAEGSTDGSDANTAKANQTGRKRSREGTFIYGGDGKIEIMSSPLPAGVNATPDTTFASTCVSGKSVFAPSPGTPTTFELRNASGMNAKTGPTGVLQSCGVLPSEALTQNERKLKWEKRKQSNRESARRSRLRKQAEAEELAHKVDSLTAENISLNSEVNELSEKSEKLRLENATLLEKLENVQEVVMNNNDDKKVPTFSTENLLSRVSNNSDPVDRNNAEGHLFEKDSKSGAKLHQLMDASPRSDAVAAG